MANEITNAVALMKDPEFRDWVCAAACYQASAALTSGTAAAKTMAQEVLLNPRGPHLERLINVLAVRPNLFNAGATVGEGGIGQQVLLTEIAAVWTPLATVLYPAA